MNSCLICGYKADYIQEYHKQEDISECLCGACLNDVEQAEKENKDAWFFTPIHLFLYTGGSIRTPIKECSA